LPSGARLVAVDEERIADLLEMHTHTECLTHIKQVRAERKTS
jgi:hypothetical protein